MTELGQRVEKEEEILATLRVLLAPGEQPGQHRHEPGPVPQVQRYLRRAHGLSPDQDRGGINTRFSLVNATNTLLSLVQVLRQLEEVEISVLYVTPEYITENSSGLTQRLPVSRITCIAVYEAHCVSQTHKNNVSRRCSPVCR